MLVVREFDLYVHQDLRILYFWNIDFMLEMVLLFCVVKIEEIYILFCVLA